MDDELRKRISEETEAIAKKVGREASEARDAAERIRKKMEEEREEMERRFDNENKVGLLINQLTIL